MSDAAIAPTAPNTSPADVATQEGMACLIFRLMDKFYGVDAHLVREIVRLPEVTPLEEAPHYVIGVINLRGHVIPIMDLHLRMGRLPLPYQVSDAVAILEIQGKILGVVISEVVEVRVIASREMEQAPNYWEQESRRSQHIVASVAQAGDEMVMLLSPDHLLHGWDEVAHASPGRSPGEEHPGENEDHPLVHRRIFQPQATPEERQLFRNRAKLLRAVQNFRDHHHIHGHGEHKMALAVVSLYGELLGIDLTIVLGFAPLRHVTPIPCCPDHIVGDMNLRGEILTLVELGRVLNMNLQPHQGKAGKVLVVGWDGLKIGIPIQEVVDVIHLFPEDIAAPPTRTGFLDREHLRGVAPYGEQMLGIVDLKKILSHENLLVNETV